MSFLDVDCTAGLGACFDEIGLTAEECWDLEQVDVFTQHTPAAWGTNYYCHRIPSAIQTPDGAVHIFAESRIAPAGYNGSCAKLDDEPPGRDDVTMRKSTDSGAQGPFPASPRFRLPAACRP